MKKPKSIPKNSPRARALEATDAVVEDLLQQDVLPVKESNLAPGTISEIGDDDPVQAGSWNDPPGATGHRAPRQPLEDEVKASEELVQSGVDEAEEELRELEEDEEAEDEKDEK